MKTLRFRRTLKNLPQTTTCKWKNQESSSVPLITKLKLFPVLLHNVTYNKKKSKTVLKTKAKQDLAKASLLVRAVFGRIEPTSSDNEKHEKVMKIYTGMDRAFM